METTEADDDDDDIELEIQSGIVRTGRETVVAPPSMEPLIQCGPGETLPGTVTLVVP